MVCCCSCLQGRENDNRPLPDHFVLAGLATDNSIKKKKKKQKTKKNKKKNTQLQSVNLIVESA
jgi:hypothetical protein